MRNQSEKQREIEVKYGKPFTEVVKELVASKGQKGAAVELGISRSTVWYWTNKQRKAGTVVSLHAQVEATVQPETPTEQEQK